MLTREDLREYQHIAVKHIIEHEKCALWMAMGLGKTCATLTALDAMRACGLTDRPALILAPLRVARDVWPDEVKKWTHLNHLTVSPIIGSPGARLAALHTKADLYTCNWENLEWLVNTLGDRWCFGPIVCDESSKLKSLRASIRQNANGTEWVQGRGSKWEKSEVRAADRIA